jgi:hypothetical protein
MSLSQVSEEDAYSRLKSAEEDFKKNPEDFSNLWNRDMTQYFISWGIRGDNTPEYARYLGYLDCKELYPDVKFQSFESFLQIALDGKLTAFLGAI